MNRSLRHILQLFILWLPIGIVAGIGWGAAFNATRGSALEGVVVVGGYALLILLAVAYRAAIERLLPSEHKKPKQGPADALRACAAERVWPECEVRDDYAEFPPFFRIWYLPAFAAPRMRTLMTESPGGLTRLYVDALLDDEDAQELDKKVRTFFEERSDSVSPPLRRIADLVPLVERHES
ncbi:MAG: hypothetical protein KJ749_05715 [Planctomycetes bacterium]|nr:hypothetical protein [Planctomycetota bacterium]